MGRTSDALELAVVCNSFSMGGTAKVAITYALHYDRTWMRPRAMALTELGVLADYPRRATGQYRPLSTREQSEARMAALRERVG